MPTGITSSPRSAPAGATSPPRSAPAGASTPPRFVLLRAPRGGWCSRITCASRFRVSAVVLRRECWVDGAATAAGGITLQGGTLVWSTARDVDAKASGRRLVREAMQGDSETQQSGGERGQKGCDEPCDDGNDNAERRNAVRQGRAALFEMGVGAAHGRATTAAATTAQGLESLISQGPSTAEDFELLGVRGGAGEARREARQGGGRRACSARW